MTLPTRVRLVTVACAALTVGASGLVVAPAPAAPTWRPDAVLSAPSPGTRYSAVVVDAEGTSTAVWIVDVDSGYVVQSATRPAGDSWSAPETLPASRADPQIPPHLAVDPVGNLTATWVRQGKGGRWVQVAQRPAGGSWSAAKDLASSGVSGTAPRVGVDAQGTATVVWSDLRDPNTDPKATAFVASRATGQAWTQPQPLSGDEGFINSPDIAVNASGEAVVGWFGNFGYRVVLRSSAGVWGAPETLPGALMGARFLDVAISDAGVASYAWNYDTGGSGATLNVAVADHARGSTWSDPHPFCATELYCNYPRIAVNNAGDAVLMWRLEPPIAGGIGVLVSTRTAGGDWSPAHVLEEDVDFDFDLQLVLDESGTATAFWTSGDDAQPVVYARHTRHGDWSVPAPFTDPAVDAYDPAVAVSPTGDITATWSSGRIAIHAAGLDVAGPRLDGFSAPTGAAPGEQLGFGAAASDAWSPVTSYSWSFGDGTSATGAAVTHAYAAPGTYAVTLTVTDKVGNTTTRTATTTVAATGTPPPALQAPVIIVFKLTDPKIQALAPAAVDSPDKTKLKIRLSTAAKVRLVVKSKHQHRVHGTTKRIKVVLTRRLPAGGSVITLRARLAIIKLPADTYRIAGTASNPAGTSAERTVLMNVVQP